ncbi:VOC family protein [Hyphococcus flavus]|uniref:VOC family protein n=1 Tax=Hyphococcus flavus TaxID=1866326 RepID=A0AAF0CIE9_9PROT|nr:VOC family protein [Hyphococcus flavus]WDI32787.1 VOC family protein [Hyphococcus flavus]
MAQTNNHVDYVEFAAEDLSVVKAFYAAAFGWEFQDWGDTYISFSGAGLDGGFRGGEKPVEGSSLTILYADNLEESEKRVVDAGGEIVERHDFPGGRRFHFRDPAGNILGVWTTVEGSEA